MQFPDRPDLLSIKYIKNNNNPSIAQLYNKK